MEKTFEGPDKTVMLSPVPASFLSFLLRSTLPLLLNSVPEFDPDFNDFNFVEFGLSESLGGLWTGFVVIERFMANLVSFFRAGQIAILNK